MNHAGHAAGDPGAVLALAAIAVAAVIYVLLAGRERRGPRGWSRWRTAGFLAGLGAAATALVPALVPYPEGSFPAHMHQHLLIGMYGPLGIILGAPMTLLLRSLPSGAAGRLGRVLGSRAVGALSHPAVGILANLGGLGLLYFTPLFTMMERHPGIHHLVHLHFFLAGCLFTYAIGGPDPGPHRPSVPSRLVFLGIAIAGHAVLAQLLYGGFGVRLGELAPDERRAGADLMYYGGDVAELLLAVVLLSTWRPRRPVAPRRPARLV